jgi:hypothetical protein
MTTNNTLNDSSTNPGSDAAVDAMARNAGNQLRHPAPTNGFARLQRAKRTHQITRAAMGTTAALALVVVGVLTLNRRAANESPAVATIGGSEPQASAPIDPNSTALPPTTVAVTTALAPVNPDVSAPPDSTAQPGGPGAVGAPSAVFTVAATSGQPVDPNDPAAISGQSLVDPLTGRVTGTEPLDWDKSEAAQQAAGLATSNLQQLAQDLFGFQKVIYDGGTLNTDFYSDVDLCGQNTVNRPANSAMPDHALDLVVSNDGKRVITASAVCPEAGKMGEDGSGTALSFDVTVQVFDVDRPEVAGRLLGKMPRTEYASQLYLSGNGRFASWATDVDSKRAVVFFDLEANTRVEDTTDCEIVWSRYSRYNGTFIGASSSAEGLRCSDGWKLRVRDLQSGSSLEIPVPNTTNSSFPSVEVDIAHYSTPESAWFTMCDAAQSRCWIGHGADPLVELTDTTEASFLPLGYYPGG